jgi:kumamolisin
MLSVLGLLLFLFPLVTACGGNDSGNAKPTPTPANTSTANNTLTTLDLGLPQKALSAPVVGKLSDDQKMHVGVTFKSNQAALDQMDKHKVKVGEKQSSADLAKQLGISEETYQKIKSYFGVEDATVNIGKLRTNITIDAKAKTFASLLHTSFVLHKLDGRTYYTPDPANPPKVPKIVADNVLAVTGLDNYSRPPQHTFHAQAQQRTATSQAHASVDCQASGDSLVPSQVSHAYGYDQFWKQGWHGEKLNVNFVEIDGVSRTDLENYFACVDYKGKVGVATIGDTIPNPGGETQLDVEMVAGLAPAVNMMVYQTDISQEQDAGWTKINDALTKIIDDNADNKDSASVVSISLGMAEDYMTIGDLRAVRQSLEILTKAEHMTVFVSSGDCGAFTSHVYGNLSVSYPASDPSVVAVGGTILGANNSGRVGEVAWSDGADKSKCENQWGTGGGLSVIFNKPSWQQGTGVKNHYSNNMRQIPDVSAVAYNLAVYFEGQWVSVGGTSAAAPIWAAGMILMNQGLIEDKQVYVYGNDLFYEIQNTQGSMHPFYDVTKGNNLYYPATAGWDYPTGLGSPNLPNLFLAISKSV